MNCLYLVRSFLIYCFVDVAYSEFHNNGFPSDSRPVEANKDWQPAYSFPLVIVLQKLPQSWQLRKYQNTGGGYTEQHTGCFIMLSQT